MVIVSVSMDENTLSEADKAMREMGFRSRSDIFRKGLKCFLAESAGNRKLESTNAVLIAMHREEHENEVTRLKHEFEGIITMQTHTKLDSEHCLEVFVLRGSGKDVGEFARLFASNRRIEYSKLVSP